MNTIRKLEHYFGAERISSGWINRGDHRPRGLLYGIGVSTAIAGPLKRGQRLTLTGLSMLGVLGFRLDEISLRVMMKGSRLIILEEGEYRFEDGGSDKKEE